MYLYVFCCSNAFDSITDCDFVGISKVRLQEPISIFEELPEKLFL